MDFRSQFALKRQELVTELQVHGLRIDPGLVGRLGRKGGAGPSDHRAVTVMGVTVMVPVHTLRASSSPYRVEVADDRDGMLFQGEDALGVISFPPMPRFYELKTADGVPYWQIAQLHARDVLATTVLQTCIRYQDVERRCQFCAIGESLRTGRTIARKTPKQLGEVAAAAAALDGVRQVVLTTGTPPTADRGARILAEAAQAIREATDLPVQAQCEPPDDFAWFHYLREAGVGALGMHLEALDPQVRSVMLPSKAEVPLAYYWRAFEAAVPVFGRGQVSTYLIAGLGDSVEGLLTACRELIALGVYPFVVPLVPVAGSRLERTEPPTPAFLRAVLEPLGAMLRQAGMTSDRLQAGCAACGACSPLAAFEAVA